jgi:hypothetical protein
MNGENGAQGGQDEPFGKRAAILAREGKGP